jgi:hypothetical protein
MNYGYGNCVISIEGDENIYSVVPYYKGIKLEKNTGYLREGYIYIYRGDISRQKKFKNGIFTDKKGKVYFALDPEESSKYSFDNIKDDSIQSIIKQAEKVDPKLKRKIMKQITQSSDIYLPELDPNDDFMKHLIKLILHDKKIDIKQFKHKFTKSHGITNLKAALETKSTADGKKGSLTLSNMIKWMELLDMDIEVIFKDSEESDLPSGKIFKYSSTDGYNVQWQDGFEEFEDEELEGDEEDED